MPIIPPANEGQRMVPGSPVPIGGEREARLNGEAVESFGKAMFALGDALDVAAKKAKDEKDRLDAADAFNQLRLRALKRQNDRLNAAPIDDDPTGEKQVSGFQGDFDQDIDEIATGIFDERVRRLFMKDAGDLKADMSAQVFAKEIVKRTELNKIKLGKVVSQYGDMARGLVKPQEIEGLMTEAKSVIFASGEFTEAQKELLAAEVDKGIVQDAINGRMQENNYKLAEDIANLYGGKVFTVEEKAQIIDKIQTESYQYDGRQLQKEALQEKQAAKANAKTEATLLEYYSGALSVAGNSDVSRAPIIKEIEIDMLNGRINPEKGRNLIASKVYSEMQDDRYEVDVMSKALSTGKYNEAIEKISKDRLKSVNGVSNDRAAKMLDDLRRWKERRTNDPYHTGQVQAGKKLIDDFAAESLSDTSLTSFDKRQLRARVNQAILSYYKILQSNPDADPKSVAVDLWQQLSATPIPRASGASSKFDQATPEQTRGSMDKLMEQYAQEKAKGLVPKGSSREKYYKETFDQLNRRLKKFKVLDPLKPIQEAAPKDSKTNNKGAGARGK